MPTHVTVTTGARLHFGPLSVGGSAARTFGGVGVMVDRPGFRIEFSQQESDEVDAGDRTDRVERCLDACRNLLPVPNCRIRIVDAPPAHAGFGAGTQLALAVAVGLFRLCGEAVPSAQKLATILGRGRRSAIGIHGFEQGGLIVDAGKAAGDPIGTLACRVALSASWRFLLITPTDESGLCGEPERAAFERLPPTPATTTDRLARLVLTGMLPAVRTGDSAAFGSALTEYGRRVGAFFAAEQGGVYAHPRGDAIVEQLTRAGASGIAQTSWGPTLCALVESESRAKSTATALAADPEFRDLAIRIAAPLNTSAMIETDDE